MKTSGAHWTVVQPNQWVPDKVRNPASKNIVKNNQERQMHWYLASTQTCTDTCTTPYMHISHIQIITKNVGFFLTICSSPKCIMQRMFGFLYYEVLMYFTRLI